MSLEFYTNRWHICYRPDGRYGRKVRVSMPATIRNEVEARRWHDEFIGEWKAAKDLDSGDPRPLTRLTIGELWPEYLKWSELHHAATTHRDIKNFGQYVKKYLGNYAAEGIGPQHVGIYQRMRSADAGRPINRTVNKEIAYFCGMVKWAGKQGHITPRKIPADRLPYERPLPQVLTSREVSAIIGACEPFYRAYLICLYAMGLRSVEARNLKWRDVDFQRRTIHVVQKGGSSGGVYRSADGTNWETFIPSDSYCRWDMDTLDGHLYLCGAYGGDYGAGCKPAVWKDTSRIWDLDLDGAGFLGIAAFKGDIYLGSANPAKVYKLSSKSVVLDKSSFLKIPKLIVDKSTDTLFALLCRGDEASSGAEVWATKDGATWKQVNGPWSCPHLYCAYYDADTGDMWLGGGKWSQKSGGYGRIYKSVRT